MGTRSHGEEYENKSTLKKEKIAKRKCRENHENFFTCFKQKLAGIQYHKILKINIVTRI